jgi:monovalent cation/hydrogen antiporter
MTADPHDLIALVLLIAAVTTMLAAAPRLHVPYPILLVLGGLAIGFVPGMPTVELQPELVLIGVLPPLLYSAAFFTSLRELRANTRPIGLLSIGLVVATTCGVAVAAHAMPAGLSWPAAFVLGAVVSPTDPIAATAIAERLGLPRRLVAIIEGESLVNDGTALVAYKFAVAAVVSGSFRAIEAGPLFVWNVAGGIGLGLVVGWIIRQVRRRLDNPPVEITIALMTGYFAWIPGDLLNVSSVLAVVTAGIYIGWHTPELTTVETRLQGDAVWEILTFLLNALLFVLVGLQLPAILDALGGYTNTELAMDALVIVLAVIAVRFAWVFPATYVPRLLSPSLRERDPYPPWQAPVLISWIGMRGAVSLAAALALPLHTDSGAAFDGRSLILFLTFAVILATLVVQGLSMTLVIRALGLEDDGIVEREEVKARIHAAEAALVRIEELAGEDWVREDTAERLRGLYNFRRGRFVARLDDQDDGNIEERSARYQRLLRELLDAEREAVLALRSDGTISDEAMRRVHRDLDLEEARLDL